MKRNAIILTIVSALLVLFGCDVDERLQMSPNFPADYDMHYGIRQLMQYDEVNVNGIDLAEKLLFLESFNMTIHFTDSKISGVTLSNGSVPFSPYDFEIPSGKQNAYLDTNVLPNELRITGTNHVVAYFQSGEFSVPFKLDCHALDYKYTFKSINQ